MVSIGYDWSRLPSIAGEAISDLGYGLTQGSNLQESLAAAGQRSAQMAQPRAEAVMLAKEQERRQTAIQQTAQALRNMGPDFEQLAMGVEAGGDPGAALAEAFRVTNANREKSRLSGMWQANSQFIQDPTYRQLVATGQMEVGEAIKLERGGSAEPFTLGPDQTRYGPNGQIIAQGMPAPPKLESGFVLGPGGKPVLDPNSKEAFDRDNAIRDDYAADATVKNYTVIRDNFEKVNAASQMQTGAGDISLVFGFMKMLDPGSVVREQEYANAQNAAGVPERIQSLYNKLLDGAFLSPDQRREFVQAAQQVYAEASNNLSDVNAQVSKRAERWGVDPANIIMSPEQFTQSVNSGAPTPVPGMSGVTIRRIN